MRIGVIGGGISGNTCAWLLSREHEVDLLEAESRPGGHTRTVDVEIDGRAVSADTGFMVYNARTYPHFCQILQELGIEGQASDMSFSVRSALSGLEYQGSSLNGLFAQRSNLVSPRFYRMLWDIVRFNREGWAWLAQAEAQAPVSGASGTQAPPAEPSSAAAHGTAAHGTAAHGTAAHGNAAHGLDAPGLRGSSAGTHASSICEVGADGTLGEYLAEHGYSDAFIHEYLVPMGAAIWSSKADEFLAFPLRFLLRFLANHGLMQLRDRPQWLTIERGARRYVSEMLRRVSGRVHLGRAVTGVDRQADCVRVLIADGEVLTYDSVVLGVHADDALRLVTRPTPSETQVLSRFAYQDNLAILHTDVRALPSRRQAWASWNYLICRDADRPVSVTYDLNRLQRLGLDRPLCLTLNPGEELAPDQVLDRYTFRHPVFDRDSYAAQSQRHLIQGQQRTYYCGAYWGYGFHEDGVRSALDVVACLTSSFADLGHPIYTQHVENSQSPTIPQMDRPVRRSGTFADFERVAGK